MALQVDLHKHFVFLVEETLSAFLSFNTCAIRSLLPLTL